MGLINCDYRTFLSMTEHKAVICYGTGRMLKEAAEEFHNTGLGDRIISLTDTDASKWNTSMPAFGRTMKVVPPEQVATSCDENTVFLITSGACVEIADYLKTCIPDRIPVFVFPFLRSLQQDQDMLAAGQKGGFITDGSAEAPPIPKKIHYCWFGRKPLPDLYKRCIESWQRYCPEYEIIMWDEDNCDLRENLYARQAYECGKYGFVPDYFRLKIIYDHGGVYLDTDVELVRNLDDLVRNGPYAGFESKEIVAFGLGFAAYAGFPLLKEMIEEYENTKFQREDKSLNLTASPVYQTRVLNRHGLKGSGELQKVAGLTIYPFEYLCAQSVSTGFVYQTRHTYSIHRYAASWVDSEKTREREAKLKLLRTVTR